MYSKKGFYRYLEVRVFKLVSVNMSFQAPLGRLMSIINMHTGFLSLFSLNADLQLLMLRLF